MRLHMALSRLVLAFSLLAAAPALAQEGPIASAGSSAVDAQIRDYLDSATAPLPATPDGPLSDTDGPVRDRAPHGEFGVGIGTNGYRSAYASTVVPVGATGTAAIAVSDTRFNGRFGPRKQQSLSVGIMLGDAGAQARPNDCREDRRAGPDPMWVTRMRAAGQPSASLICAPRP